MGNDWLMEDIIERTEIRILGDDAILTKIDDETYFGPRFSGYISNSRLSLLNPDQGGSPERFFNGFVDETPTPSLALGTAIHELVLQPGLSHVAFDVVRPSAKAGAIADMYYAAHGWDGAWETFRDNVGPIAGKVGYYNGSLTEKKMRTLFGKCSEYLSKRKEYESHELPSRPLYMDKGMQDKVCECLASINDTPEFDLLLNPRGVMRKPKARNEHAVLARLLVHMPGGVNMELRVKAKVDNYFIDHDNDVIVINDLKTIGKPVEEFGSNVDAYHYKRELAFYRYLLSAYHDDKRVSGQYAFSGNFLVVSTVPPFRTSVARMTDDDFEEGTQEFMRLLKMVAYYRARGFRFADAADN